jgi:hypothetical protein
MVPTSEAVESDISENGYIENSLIDVMPEGVNGLSIWD